MMVAHNPLKHYMGAPCRRGHDGLRYLKGGACVHCAIGEPHPKQRIPRPTREQSTDFVGFNPDRHFVSDLTCKRGHAVRYKSNNECVECVGACKEASAQRTGARKRYYAKNSDKIKERARKWQEENDGRYRERIKKYSEAHREEAKIRAAEWVKANPERKRETSKRWVENNKQKHRENCRRWAASNLHKMNAWNRTRRARLMNSEGTHTATDIAAIFAKQRNRCAACGKKAKLEADHYHPLARGGSNYAKNIQGLCKSCNSAKQARDPIDFMRSRGFLL